MAELEETKIKSIDTHTKFTTSRSIVEDFGGEIDQVIEKYREDLGYHEIIGVIAQILFMENLGGVEFEGD
jgi:hypothetical protein